MPKYQPNTFSSSLINYHRLRKRSPELSPLHVLQLVSIVLRRRLLITALQGRHEQSDAEKKNRSKFGNDANLEKLSLIYSFKLYICQDPRIAWAYTAQNKKTHFSLVTLSVRLRVYTEAGSCSRPRYLAHAVHASSHTPGSWCLTLLWVSDGTGQITLLRLVSSLGPLMTRVWKKRHAQF